MNKQEAKTRLEYLRGELRSERLSYGELDELQSLAKYIDQSDVELLEAAGLPEKCYQEHGQGKYKGLSVPHYHDN